MRAAAALLLCALALGGCESSQEKSSQLEQQAKLARAKSPLQGSQGLSITHASKVVQVVSTQTVHSSEGTAVLVTLRNTSTHTLRSVPIAITVKGAGGSTLYQNNSPGLEAALTSVALLAAGQQLTWINDQVQSSEAPASASAEVGEAPPASGAVPQIRVEGVHPSEEAGTSGAAGVVVNDSPIIQRSLVVYGVARRGARIVAAGRAVLPEVPAHGSDPFQILFIGKAQGARLQVTAAPTKLG